MLYRGRSGVCYLGGRPQGCYLGVGQMYVI